MARSISDEELQLKKRARRRLVGAIVLVAGVAVVLPMVLDSEPKPVSRNVDIQIPSPDSPEFKAKGAAPPAADAKASADTAAKSAKPESVPAQTPNASTAGAGAAAQASGTEPKSTVADAKSATPDAKASGSDSKGSDSKLASADAKSVGADTAKGKDASADKSSGKDAVGGGAYVVQVAALANAAKVKQLQKQMASAGVKTYTEVINTDSGKVTRVRAGPYPTKEAAERARAQLKKAGLEGTVVPR